MPFIPQQGNCIVGDYSYSSACFDACAILSAKLSILQGWYRGAGRAHSDIQLLHLDLYFRRSSLQLRLRCKLIVQAEVCITPILSGELAFVMLGCV